MDSSELDKKRIKDQLDAWVVAHPGGLVVMALELASERGDITTSATISGFNYSTGKRGTWVVARVLPES